MKNTKTGTRKILIGQLASYGDCLCVTTIARQIKNDYPGCHLTWAIGSAYKSILKNNPYVDEVWDVPLDYRAGFSEAWLGFEAEALKRTARGDFDEVFLTQLWPNNMQNFDGILRTSIFRAYPGPITVPSAPVLRLSPDEIEKVRLFAGRHGLKEKKNVILLESSPGSHQSHMTIELALEISKKVISACPDSAVVISSERPFTWPDKRVVDASVLSFRENAELTKYCSLLVGCASGISWLALSDWAKPIPMIQIIKKNGRFPVFFERDHEILGLPADNIIEMYDSAADKAVQCIVSAITSGFSYTRSCFYEKHPPVNFDLYDWFFTYFIKSGQFGKALRLLTSNISVHGPRPRFIIAPVYKFAKNKIIG